MPVVVPVVAAVPVVGVVVPVVPAVPVGGLVMPVDPVTGAVPLMTVLAPSRRRCLTLRACLHFACRLAYLAFDFDVFAAHFP